MGWKAIIWNQISQILAINNLDVLREEVLNAGNDHNNTHRDGAAEKVTA